MGKNPAFQFYPHDWVDDTRRLSLAARGAWIDLLCSMWWANPRGKITASIEQFSRILGAEKSETEQVIAELISVRILENLTEPNGDLTLISRRMIRDDKSKESDRIRAKRYYDKQVSHAILTVPSPSPIPSPTPKHPNSKPKTIHYPASQNSSDSSEDEWLVDDFSRSIYEFLKKSTLDGKPCSSLKLMDCKWWDQTSVTTGGLDLEILNREFARMNAWMMENRSRVPTPNGMRRFVRGWLERSYERERRNGNHASA